MQRFFVRPEDIEGDIIKIYGDDANHIAHALRSKVGDVFLISPLSEEGQQIEYLCEITGFAKGLVTFKVIKSSVCQTEPPYRARLFMALPKGDKMEYIIQKSTELGVCEITPVITERCIVKIDPHEVEKNEKKVQRWQKIAEAAASQSGRGIIPKINMPIVYREAVKEAKSSPLAFLCYEGDGTTPLPEILKTEFDIPDISFIIGSEGGFSIKEVEIAKEEGLMLAGLGKRILRCETAPLFVLSSISFAFEL